VLALNGLVLAYPLSLEMQQQGFPDPVLITILPTWDHPSSSLSLRNQGDGAYLCGERAIEERFSHCHL